MSLQKWNKLDQDVLDCLRFYIMLSIHLGAVGNSKSFSEKSLNEYIKEGEYWHNNDSKIRSSYISRAYQTLPAEFLNRYDLKLDARDEIKFLEKGIW